MSKSNHARRRAQQRGISDFILTLLLEHGRTVHDHRGAEICFFDKRGRKRVERYTRGLVNADSEALDAYAVLAESRVITIGHRLKRVKF